MMRRALTLLSVSVAVLAADAGSASAQWRNRGGRGTVLSVGLGYGGLTFGQSSYGGQRYFGGGQQYFGTGYGNQYGTAYGNQYGTAYGNQYGTAYGNQIGYTGNRYGTVYGNQLGYPSLGFGQTQYYSTPSYGGQHLGYSGQGFYNQSGLYGNQVVPATYYYRR